MAGNDGGRGAKRIPCGGSGDAVFWRGEAVSGWGRQTMKRPPNKERASRQVDAGEILPEYDFSRARRNPYASSYASGSVVVVLKPDVAAAFPSSEEANQALRALAGIIAKHRSRAPVTRRRS